MWAAAPVASGFKALEDRLKPSRSMGTHQGIALAEALHVSLHIHSICEVQERLLEMPALSFRVFPRGTGSDINLRV